MAISFLLLNVFIVMIVAYFRFSGTSLRYAAPAAMNATVWWCIIATAAAAGITLAWIGCAAWYRRKAQTAMFELLLVFPLFFAYEWGVLPPRHWRWFDWGMIGALITIMLFFLYRHRKEADQWGLTGKNFWSAAKWLAFPTLVMITLPLIGAALWGTDLKLKQIPVMILGYPFYAFAQLLIFQLYLVTRLRKISHWPPDVIIAAAGLFALLHWPNGALMIATGAAAVIWTIVYIYRPNLYAITLSMALSACALCALPDGILYNLRTGPYYVWRHSKDQPPPAGKVHP